MFFNTHTKLLRPIHSLLKEPFSFSARASISGPLGELLSHRSDYDSLLALGQLYDQMRLRVQGKLIQVRPLLNESLSVVIPADTDIKEICQTAFTGTTPQLPGMDAAYYLSHVSVQCQLERLYDLMGLQHMGAGNALQEPDVAEAVRLLMLNEALALCLAGIAKVDQSVDQFDVSIYDPSARDALRATWFARIADQGSHSGTIVLVKTLANAGATTVHELEPLIDRILDQNLSIPWRQLTPQGRELQSIQEIYNATALVAVLAVSEARGESVKMIGSDLTKYGLDFSAISKLLHRQAQALVTDRFVTRQGSTLRIRFEAASKGLRCYYRALEMEFGECDALRQHVGGFFFEKTHIKRRIENGADYQPRYRIFDGFDRYQVLGGAPNETDVEFIICDVEQRHYYFAQIKHALLGEKAFFNSVVEAIQKDLGQGINQLREAKRLLESKQLGDTLAVRGIQDATPENCSFVLLHNIAQFDFQSTEDGISLYDWATFRNLLKDAECFRGSSNGDGELIRLPSALLVDHPMRVISRLLAEHPAYKDMYNDVWATERATTTYKVQGKTIYVRGLGI